MGTTNITVTLLEHCRISPPTDAVTDSYLPLTFFDIRWLGWRPLHRLLFYDFPYSTTDFYQTLVPNLKNSLCLLLKHYFPFAGNLIIPSTPLSIRTKPQIRYLDGDSVSLTIAECNNNLNHLTGNHARYVDDLFPLVPQLPSAATDGGCVVAPLFALQVTLFPNHGFTVGFTNSHVVADGSTMVNFIREWASIAKQLRISSRDDNDDAPSSSAMLLPLPFHDRSVIKDPKGLAAIYWRHYIDNSRPQLAEPTKEMVQATFVMCRADIQGLKNLVSTQLPTLAHVSSYTVICAYLWTCMAKTRVAIGEEVDDRNEVEEHFIFPMDCRARLDPPIPATYFGNCITGCVATRKSIQLVGEEGFVAAAEAIGEAIHTKVNNKEGGVMKRAEMWYVDIEAMRGQRMFGVAGSPKFDYYGADFGWGMPKKFEVVSEKFSLNSGGGGAVEIGFCFPKNEMDAFTTIFAKGLVKEAQKYAHENDLFFMETSAQSAANVNDSFYEIAKKIYLCIYFPMMRSLATKTPHQWNLLFGGIE